MTEICPLEVSGFYNLCWTFLHLSRCGEAVEACMGALKIDKDHRESRGALTKAQECQALADATINDLQRRIRRNPGDPELHFGLGIIYYEKRLPQQALTEFLNTIKLSPRHVLAHYWAARVYDDQLRADETVGMCKAFVDLLRGDQYSEQKAWCVSRVNELQYQ